MNENPDPALTLVKEGAVELVRSLKQGDGKDLGLVGAGALAATLFAAELVLLSYASRR